MSTELEAARRRIREYEWDSLKAVAVKAGIDPDKWDLVRFDLSSRKLAVFSESDDIESIAGSRPEQFFKEVYSGERPKFYKAVEEKPKQTVDDKRLSAAELLKLSPTEQLKYARENQPKMSRQEFDQLSHAERHKFAINGGTLFDD